MSSSLVDFDPYREWLRIAHEQRPLNAYQLLDLQPLESDGTRIRVAVQRQQARLEEVRPDADEQLWQSLHEEVEMALDTLFDPEKKAVLDATIRRKQASATPKPPGVASAALQAASVACRGCNQSNAANRRFCSSCGHTLWEKCPQCSAECAADERFCGSCGTDIHGGYRQQQEKLESRLQQAQQLASEHKFDSAISLLRGIAAIDDVRFERWSNQALDEIQAIESQRSELGDQASHALAHAQKQLAEHSYENAAGLIEEIPEPLRSPEASRLLQQAKSSQNELITLGRDIRETVAQKRYWELLPKVERFLQLKPGHTQTQQLARQLGEHFVKLAKAKLASHHYDEAAQALKQVPSLVRSSDVDSLADKAAELQSLMEAIRSAPLADKTLLALITKVVKVAPSNEEAAKLLAQLQQRMKTKPTNARAIAPDWTPAPKRSAVGCPVEALGHIQNLAAATPEMAARLAEQPGQYFVALGLALQGLGEAAVDLDLMPKEKGGVLGKLNLSFSKAKAKAAWGLDLSDFGLKAIKLSRDDKSGAVKLEACEYILHSKPLTAPEAEMDRSLIAESTLRDFLSRVELIGSKIAVGVPGHRMLGRFFDLPPLPQKKVENAVQFEAKHQIPISLDELCWDYKILYEVDAKSADERPRRMMVAAVREMHVTERLSPFKAVGIKVDLVQSECVAIHNAIAFEFFRGQAGGTDGATASASSQAGAVAVVDVGAGSTNVVISSPRSIWFRSFSQAGDSFTSALVKQLKLTQEQAEQWKRDPAKARRFYQLQETLQPLLVQIASEVDRSLGSYRKLYPDHPIRQLYGIGGGFQLHGLLRQLREGK